MFNGGIRGKRANDGQGTINPQSKFVQTISPLPSISGYTISGIDDTALDPSGGQTVLVNGTGFATGVSATLGGTQIGAVTLVSPTQISFTTPAKSAGSYTLVVYNSAGGAAILVPGLTYSGVPTYSTSAGSIGTYYETTAISTSVTATSDSSLTYTLASGSLPSGASLNSNGTITGTSPASSGSTTYTFAITATDAELQDVTRTFTLTINTDVITWASPANASVITSYEYSNISNVTLSASSAVGGTSVTYSANSLPTGITLSGNTISGMSNTVANTATLLTATGNATSRTATDTIYFNVQQDVVTWSNPSSGATIILDGTAYSNTLSATSAAGKSITYTANSLPTGLTLSAGTISGTPTVDGSSSTLLTATAATTNRSATNTISWVVNLNDANWKYTSLLLNGSTVTTTFINDASLNNTELTIGGDTKPNNNNPYRNGYYSNYLDGASYILGTMTTGITIGTSDFCLEGWGYWTSFNYGTYGAPIIALYSAAGTSELMIRANKTSAATTSANFFSILTSSTYIPTSMYTSGVSVGTLYLHRWHHLCVQRIAGTWYFYIDGVMLNSTSTGNASLAAAFVTYYIGADGPSGGGYIQGNVSNVRLIVGTTPYSSSGFTVPTSPLSLTADTKFLSAQSNKYLDTSANNAVMTTSGTTRVDLSNPFATPTTTSYNTLYSTRFDGTGDYLTTTTSTGFGFGTGTFTFECWVYPTSNPTNGPGTLIDCRSGINAEGWVVRIFNNLTVGLYNGPSNVYVNSTGTVTMNTWQHIAIVRSSTSSGGVVFYINGSSAGTATVASNLGTTWVCKIGTNYAPGYDFYGNISNLRVVKGDTVYTANFSPSTTPLTAVSGTSLLTCQNATLIDNSTNAFTITSNGEAQPIAVSPFTMTTSSTTVTGLGSAYFDGTGDFIRLPASSNFSFPGDYTVEFWVYFLSTSSSDMDLVSNYVSNVSTDWIIMHPANSPFQYYPSSANSYINGPTPVANRWYHLAAVRSGTTCTFYVDGVSYGSLTFSGTLGDATKSLYLGSRGGGAANFLNGYMSDVRITKTALYTSNFLPPQTPLTPVTNTSLLTLQYNGGANNNGFVDQGSFNNIITRNGSVTQGTFSPYIQNGWSTYYNGSSDYMYSSGGSGIGGTSFGYGTGDFTWEMWIFPTSSSWTTGNFYMLDHGSNSGVLQYNTNLIRYYSPAGTAFDTATGLVPANTWTHIAVSRVSQIVTIYVNGTSVRTGSDTSNYGTSQQLWIARYGGGGQYFPGYISNLRIVKGVGVYTGNFTVPTTPLTASQTAGTNIAAIAGQTSLLINQNSGFVNNSPVPLAFDGGTTLGISGTPSIQAYSPFGGITSVPTSYSNYFDGTGDYLQTPASSTTAIIGGTGAVTTTSTFTVECWIYQTQRQTDSPPQMVGDMGTNGSLYWSFGPTSTGKLGFYWYDGSAKSAVGNDTIALNTWTHIAMSISSGAIKLFVNGVLQTITGTSSTTNQSGSFGYLMIGMFYTGGSTYGYFGNISNLRITKSALYSTTFTPSTTPLTASASTGLLTCQSNTMVDNSPNYFAITSYGDTKPKPFNPFGTTNTSLVSYDPAVHGGGLYFDGTTDYLSLAHDPVQWLGATDFTIEAWFYSTKAPGSSEQTIISKQWQGASAAYASYLIYIETAGTLRFLGSTSGGSWELDSGSTTYSYKPFQWQHVALTRSGNTFRLFANGILDKTITNSGTLYNHPNPLIIGTAGAQTGYNAGMQGWLSDVRILKGVSLYNANFYPGSIPLTSTATVGSTRYSSVLLVNGTSGGIIDYHGTNSLETVGNTQLASEDPYNGSYYSNYFSGASDYLTVGSTLIPSTGDFTIEFWIYSNTSAGSNQRSVYSQYNSGSAGRFMVGLDQSSTRAWLHYNGSDYYSTVGTLLPSKWYHYVLTRSGDVFNIYLNGTLVAANTFAGASLYQGNPQISGSGGSFIPNANISNLRIITGQVLYTGSFTPATNPLTTSSIGTTGANVAVSISGTVKLLACQSNKFIDNSSNAYTLTVSGSPQVKSLNPFQKNTGKSLYFGTKTDYYGIRPWPGITQFGADFTMECWVYPSENSLTATSWGIYDGRQSGQSAAAIILTLDGYSSGGWLMSYYNGTQYKGTTRVPSGCWTHVAFVRSGTTMTFFVNGVAGGTATISGTQTASATTNPIYIGSKDSSLTGYGTLGYIKDLRITNGVARYTTTFTPPTVAVKTK